MASPSRLPSARLGCIPTAACFITGWGGPSASQSPGTEGPGLAQPTSEAVATPVAAPVKIKTVVREAGLGPVGITGWVLFGLAGSVFLVMVLRRRRTEPGT